MLVTKNQSINLIISFNEQYKFRPIFAKNYNHYYYYFFALSTTYICIIK